jgi:hypothetical protein
MRFPKGAAAQAEYRLRGCVSLLVLATAAALSMALGAGAGRSALLERSVSYKALTKVRQTGGISSVVVSDGRAGLLLFEVKVTRWPDLTDGRRVSILIDADRSAATGDTSIPGYGVDYLYYIDSDGVELYRWLTRNSYARYVKIGTPAGGVSYRRGVARFHLSLHTIGSPRAFFFFAQTLSGLDSGSMARVSVHDAPVDPRRGLYLFSAGPGSST